MENDTYEVVILEADKPTLSGRIYSEKYCKDIVEKINIGEYPVLENVSFNKNHPNGDMIGKTTSAEYRDGKVVVNMIINNKELYDVIAPFGIGKVSSSVITDYKLLGIQAKRKS